MKKLFIIIFILSACGGGEISEETVEVPTTVKATTTSTTTSTLITTTTSILTEVMPTVKITCEPVASDEEGLMTFKFEVTTGTNELVVINIVSWFDSSRTDDLFISDGLPSPGSSNVFGYTVDTSFSQYEIEIVVMDSKDNFADDYCLWPVPEPIDLLPDIPDNPGDSKNCGDFVDYAEAKAWFDTYYEYYGDVAKLDSDDDLEPCESLPGGP